MIIFIGDGGTACPNTNRDTYVSFTLSFVQDRNDEMVPIHTIHIGAGDSSFEQVLASQNNGTFTTLPDNPGGGQTPSDSNQDGRFNLSDSLHLLFRLFEWGRFPCGDRSIEDGANLLLLDANGDSSVNIADVIYGLLR